MRRKLDIALLEWKKSADRKPLILIGARQTGKTTSLLNFGKTYKTCIYIDFIENKNLCSAFKGTLDPKRIIENLEAALKTNISTKDTLLIFDEAQECQEAISSLKYFKIKMPELHICCAGSFLGLYFARNNVSFPVGHVDIKYLHPMDFEEFCWANSYDKAFNIVKQSFRERTYCAVHEDMCNLYKNYLIVGGMPEGVKNWSNNHDFSNVKNIQSQIITGYIADMSKYATATDSSKIYECWKSIPDQLAKESGSTKFQWGLLGSGAKASKFKNSIEWLATCGLIDVVNQVKCIESPLQTFVQPQNFKVYLNDVGLLSSLYNATPQDLESSGPRTARFRGSLAENYVSQQLCASETAHFYWGVSSKAEVEFVISGKDGALPIDVKSGKNTRSISLINVGSKYNCKYVVTVSAKNFGFENGIYNIPLYAASLLNLL